MTSRAERNKPCPSCGTPVHRQRRTCPACGTLSPWRMGEGDELYVGEGLGEADDDLVDETELTAPPADPDPPPPAVAEPDPPAAARVDLGPHVVLRDSRVMLGDVYAEMKAGRIIEGDHTIRALFNRGVPLLPVAEAPGWTCCPKCRHIFDTRIINDPGGRNAGATVLAPAIEAQRQQQAASQAARIAEDARMARQIEEDRALGAYPQ